MTVFVKYLQDETGATAIEYSLLIALISIALIGGANSLSQNINARFEGVSTITTTAG